MICIVYARRCHRLNTGAVAVNLYAAQLNSAEPPAQQYSTQLTQPLCGSAASAAGRLVKVRAHCSYCGLMTIASSVQRERTGPAGGEASTCSVLYLVKSLPHVSSTNDPHRARNTLTLIFGTTHRAKVMATSLFCHIQQVAALNAKLVVVNGACATHIWREKVGRCRDRRWYHSKKQWWSPIGSAL